MYRVKLTEKAKQLIEKVKSGLSVSYDELELAELFYRLTHGWYRSISPERPIIARLISEGYIEVYEDKALDMLEREFSGRDDFEFDGNDYEITDKAKSLMNLMTKGIALPPRLREFGCALWQMCNDEKVPPWLLKALLEEGYIVERKDG